MTHGLTAWPSDAPLGGGGFVDLTGAKNPPAETSQPVWITPPPPSEATNPNAPPTIADWVKRMGDIGPLGVTSFVGVDHGWMDGSALWFYDPCTDSIVVKPREEYERRAHGCKPERAGLHYAKDMRFGAQVQVQLPEPENMYDKIFAASPRPDLDSA